MSPFIWTTRAQIKPTTAPLRGAVVGFIPIFVYRVSKFLSACRGLKLRGMIADIQCYFVLKFELSSSYRKIIIHVMALDIFSGFYEIFRSASPVILAQFSKSQGRSMKKRSDCDGNGIFGNVLVQGLRG